MPAGTVVEEPCSKFRYFRRLSPGQPGIPTGPAYKMMWPLDIVLSKNGNSTKPKIVLPHF